MAELVKKLKLQNTKGVVESCTLYSTKEEANAMGGVLPLHVDGVDCFAVLGAVTESEATSGRQEKNGVSLAILKQGGITPGSITVKGTGTFTVPKGVAVLQMFGLDERYRYIKVEEGKTYHYMSYTEAGLEGDDIVAVTYFQLGNFYIEDGVHPLKVGSRESTPMALAWSNSINKQTPNGTA